MTRLRWVVLAALPVALAVGASALLAGGRPRFSAKSLKGAYAAELSLTLAGVTRPGVGVLRADGKGVVEAQLAFLGPDPIAAADAPQVLAVLNGIGGSGFTNTDVPGHLTFQSVSGTYTLDETGRGSVSFDGVAGTLSVTADSEGFWIDGYALGGVVSGRARKSAAVRNPRGRLSISIGGYDTHTNQATATVELDGRGAVSGGRLTAWGATEIDLKEFVVVGGTYRKTPAGFLALTLDLDVLAATGDADGVPDLVLLTAIEGAHGEARGIAAIGIDQPLQGARATITQ